ncbi:MAG: ABC-F family ATP-binding cassette domain-containing protein [Lachnospiraceae bacterium]|nr:ABC-F family ATP-binding cassette domain-containing protein [Lachnospiraceae bacterium]
MRYQIKHALVQYAADTILEDVNFEVHDNEKIAIVGRNGCGKTTLLKLIAGDIHMNNLDSDEECGIVMAGKQEIGFLRQISFTDGDITVEEEIKKTFAPVFECEARMAEIEQLLHEEVDNQKLLNEYDALQKKMEALRGYSWRRDMEMMFQQFGFSLVDLNRPIGDFSGGQQTKVAFIKLLLSRPDIMLLDEPTNHLDLPTIEWLENYLKNYDKAVIIVSHDRMFLDRIIDVTYEIEYHQIKRYPGNYTAFLKRKEENLIKQEKDYEEQQKEIQRLTEWIEKWKNTPTKVAATRSKRMAIEHMVKVEKPRRFDTKTFHAMFTPRIESYTEVLSVKNLRIGYDTELSKVSFTLQKGERLAILGENGKGKSTLLNTLVGILEALGGSFTFGQNVEWGYFDQQVVAVNDTDPEQTVLENFWDEYPKLLREEVRSALGSFMFSHEDVMKKMGQLSGGEKVRLALCKMFQTKPNLLILDEPTNHIDIMGKQALEQMLQNFKGTVLFVSHDRYFIKQVATEILEFEQENVRQYHCGYEEYLQEKAKLEISDRVLGNNNNRRGTNSADIASATARNKEQSPVLQDAFNKKDYYNPGKIKSRLIKQLEKYEKQLEESEEKVESLKMELLSPELATDYQKLMELQNQLEKEEAQQESLLERIMEMETELEELESDNN